MFQKRSPPICSWDPYSSPSFSILYQQVLLFKLYFKSHVCGSLTYLYKDNTGGKCDDICSYMENELTDVLTYACYNNIWRKHKFIKREHVVYILWSKVEREFGIEEVVLCHKKKRKRREKTSTT